MADSADTVNQILVYGTLQDIRKLLSRVGKEEVKRIFLTQPKKEYSKPTFQFITKFILGIQEPLDANRYLKTAPRAVRR